MFDRGDIHDLRKKQAEREARNAPAEKIAKTIGPRSYILEDTGKDIAAYIADGCGGTGSAAQKRVAKLADEVVKNNPTDFRVQTGDNFYNNGVSSADDEAFENNYEKMYFDENLTALCQLPGFLTLGNHDENLHSIQELSTHVSGESLALHQVAHHYLDDPKKREAIAEQAMLKKEDLGHYNMFYLFYSVIHANAQLFFLNSNSLALHYLRYKKPSSQNTIQWNQFEFLKKQYAEAKQAGRAVHFIIHNPLVMLGSRAYKSLKDIKLYIQKDEDIVDLHNLLFPENPITRAKEVNYPLAKILLRICELEGLIANIIVSAHEHALYLWNNIESSDLFKFCQVIFGGGGGSLQDRRFFGENEKVAFALRRYGLGRISWRKDNPQLIFIDSYSLSEAPKWSLRKMSFFSKPLHLKFTNQNCEPIRDEALPPLVKQLHDAVKAGCDQYAAFLHQKQTEYKGHYFHKNIGHGHEGVERMHNVSAYLLQPVLPDFDQFVIDIHALIEWSNIMTSPTPESLYTYINNEVKKQFGGQGIEDLYKKAWSVKNQSSSLLEQATTFLKKMLG